MNPTPVPSVSPLSARLVEKAKRASVVFAVLAALLIPSYLTLKTVHVANAMVPASLDPSPLGYTWSLLLFIVPIVFIVIWLHSDPSRAFPRKAFYITVGIIAPLGFILDLFFGEIFFTFVNKGAVLGIYLPGFDVYTWSWDAAVLPIEEFAFYVFGIAAVLLIYLWATESWLSAYGAKAKTKAHLLSNTAIKEKAKPKNLFDPAQIHWVSIVWGIVAILLADVYYQKHSGYHLWPGYFTFIVLAAIVPSGLFYPIAKPRINWQAFSFTLVFILLVSLLWEASLAAPYQWWGYHHEQMLGIFIAGWYDLPIEAVMIWLMVTFTTVIIYEVIAGIVAAKEAEEKNQP
ncbi:MAG TPA: hypothetical protein VIM58_11785 [Candidatus Methylacidiphilales bacterium]